MCKLILYYIIAGIPFWFSALNTVLIYDILILSDWLVIEIAPTTPIIVYIKKARANPPNKSL